MLVCEEFLRSKQARARRLASRLRRQDILLRELTTHQRVGVDTCW